MENKFTAVVEIPKGSDRRIHKEYNSVNFIDLGPIKEKIPINDGVMPICYGFLEGFLNREEIQEQVDEIDVLIFSNKNFKTGDKVQVKVFGGFLRDDNDHKIFAVDDSLILEDIKDIDKDLLKQIIDFFGFNHKINKMLNKDEAIKFLEDLD